MCFFYAGFMAWKNTLLPPLGKDPAGDTGGISIYAVRDWTSKDLDDALALYKEKFKRLSPDEFDPPEEIQRWIREVHEASRIRQLFFDEYFLVAKEPTGKICGAAYLTWYATFRLAYISYLVAKGRRKDDKDKTTDLLMNECRRLLRRVRPLCQGVVTEVKNPDLAGTSQDWRKRVGRIHIYDRIARKYGLVLWVLHFDYIQSRLSMEPEKHDRPMLLLYISLRDTNSYQTFPKKKIMKLLRFVYFKVYADSFASTKAKYEPYQSHLRDLYQTVCATLPGTIKVRSAEQYCRKQKEQGFVGSLLTREPGEPHFA